ncbi:unnamed protein product [Ceutorhynchus assimilis]|nr:unnamed protein product [Ceutorhynchus assimilis]
MNMNCFIVITVALIWCQAARSIESNFYYEECCGKKGGACVLKNECPQPVSEEFESLCPLQKSLGAVCCKGIKSEDLNCYQQHNACFDPKKCPNNLNLGKKGCPEKQICCVLV